MNEFIKHMSELDTSLLYSSIIPFNAQRKEEEDNNKTYKRKTGEFLLNIYKMSRNENGKAQPPEKSSNFTRRCSLLSRYLKEKGSFGNIDLGLVRKPDELPGNSDPQGKIKALEVLQRVSKGEASNSSGSKAKDTNLSKPLSSEPGSSQLTIFFGGQVLVYNEFPADKAKEIMEVAKQSKPVTAEINIQTQFNIENKQSNMVNLPDLNEPTNSVDINQQQQQQNKLVERIARRASLHRFFSKRKDRAAARAPYQVNQNAGHHLYPPKPETAHGQPLESGNSSKRPENPVAQTMSHPKPEGGKNIYMEIEEEGQCSKDLELRL